MKKQENWSGMAIRGGMLLYAFSFLVNPSLFAQTGSNPPFPRTAILQWGGGTADWLGRFDLVITNNLDSLTVRSARTLHPETKYLATSDWNAGIPFKTSDPEFLPVEWRVRTPSGGYVLAYDEYYLPDISNYCGLSNGERYNQALARVLMEKTDWSAFDGVHSDGSWTFPWPAGPSTGIDLDRNGLDDYTEPGKGREWVRQKWQDGYRAMMKDLRARFQARWGNPDQKLIGYWSVTDTMCASLANGVGWENAPDHGPEIVTWLSLMRQWEAAGPSPSINYVCAGVRYDSVHAPARKKDYFRFMRWMLGVTLLTDSYFMMDDDDGHHRYNFYYDEFDAKLGYPTGGAQQLPNGCRVRFFDGGVVIVNPTNSTQTVSDGDLAGRSGYAGPYHRFKGNQDTSWNTGEQFTSVTLKSTPASWPGNTQNVGDAIILLKTPRVVVTDIIVDNAYAATSPGSAEATLTGFTWDQQANGNRANPLWYTGPYLDIQSNPEYWRSRYAPAGTGSAVAVFRPTINVAGRYEVYEWHGWRGANAGSYSEATNVPCSIAHEGGTDHLIVNQRTNAGQWNLLGTYTFLPGGAASVTINNNANGFVIADAFRFVYAGPDSSTTGGRIRGKTFFDKNGNGSPDINEQGMPGWTIRLSGPMSQIVQTGYDGSFDFDNLVYGSYTLTQDTQPNWIQTSPPPGTTNTIIVGPDSANNWCNFGNYSASAVGLILESDWNLVSLPIITDSMHRTSVFPSSNSDAYRYSSGFVPVDFLHSGKGYWLKFPEAQSVWISGEPLVLDTTMLGQGWNLVGSIGVTRSVNATRTLPDGILMTPFYGYQEANYLADSIVPGEGYWVKSAQPGILILGDTSLTPKRQFSDAESLSMNSLVIGTRTNSSQALYFSSVAQTPSTEQYSMPPVPPSGAFDVRFLTGTDSLDGQRAVFYDQSPGKAVEFPVRIQSGKSSLSIRWTIRDRDARYALVCSNGTVTELTGSEGEVSYDDDSIEANGVSTFVLRVLPAVSSPVPETFELMQNFPNPFNNSTTVRFSLPSAGWVKLDVYNVLGEMISTLTDMPFEAGRHEVHVETANWSSGVYLYKILVDPVSGEGYSQVKLMTLLK